jgi:2-polyprenyl-3-methyl-5-hydroxy-6-metoxy-1,4-benzoquinol methylase
MLDWYKYWNRPTLLQESDFLRQVGKTVHGQSIPEINIDVIARDIVGALMLHRKDRVLDLCCGNGMITHRCAQQCLHITGVDFSKPLIRTASTFFPGKNITYIEADVRYLPYWLAQQTFTKVYMYEALQHISNADARKLLLHLRNSASASAAIFFGSVPDRAQLWKFYNTAARRHEYRRRVKEGTEAIGHWWAKSELTRLANDCGYRVKFMKCNPILHGAHYRLDALFLPCQESSCDRA